MLRDPRFGPPEEVARLAGRHAEEGGLTQTDAETIQDCFRNRKGIAYLMAVAREQLLPDEDDVEIQYRHGNSPRRRSLAAKAPPMPNHIALV
jgi:hypothetical protein